MIKATPTQEELLALLRYDPETGKLYWRERPLTSFRDARSRKSWNARLAGKEAFTSSMSAGYRQGHIHNKHFLAHRLIFKMLHDIDAENIDHIDGDRTNNRPENLRAASRLENQRNQKKRWDNASGITGVCWDAQRSKWLAYIRVKGIAKMLGRFESIEAATRIRKRAEAEHGFHPNHGRAA